MQIKRIVTAVLIAALVAAMPSGAAGPVTVNAVREGTDAVVTGAVALADTPFTLVAEDVAGDSQAGEVATVAGGDLRGFEMATTASGDIAFRWVVESLPPVGVPGPVYGITFIVDGTQGFELDVARATTNVTNPTAPGAALWSCVGTDCTPDTQTRKTATIPVTVDAATSSITATVKAADLGAKPGSIIEETTVAPGSVFIAGGVVPSPYLYDVFDSTYMDDTYTVGQLTVQLGTAPAGTAADAVTYATSATVTGSDFAGRLPAAPGDAVYARACFGAGNCTDAATAAIP